MENITINVTIFRMVNYVIFLNAYIKI
jgi:hypothetical protein